MTGLIPQSFIDEILNRTDIVELVDSHIPLKKQGTSFVARCPFHSEKTPSFNVVAKKQFYHCFGCGASGNAISFVMAYLQQDFVAAVETLATRLGLEIPRDPKIQQTIQFNKDYYQLLERISQYYQHQLKDAEHAVDYLRARGLTGEIAKRYQLGYAPSGWNNLNAQFSHEHTGLSVTGMIVTKDDGNNYDRYRNRIMFPIHDRRGRVIGFGGRSVEPDDKPKYLNSPETVLFQKNKELYGLYQAINQQKELPYLLVVEGYMDVIALAQHGIDYAVATLGTATSDAHIQLLARHSRQLYFCFDGDKAGKQAAWRALQASFPNLADGLDVRFVFLPSGYDPDSLIREQGREVFQALMKQAPPINQFFFDSLRVNTDTSTLAGKTQLINKAMQYLKQVPMGSYLNLLLQQLSRYTHIDIDRLQAMLKQNTKKDRPQVVSSSNKQVPSNLRLITALLLQAPELYPKIKAHIQPELLDTPQYAVLNQLIALIAPHPTITTAGLIEHWRETDLFNEINQLASWKHPVPESGMAAELIGAFNRLETQAISQKIELLLHQASQRGLTHEEKQTLQTMIQLRMKKKFSAEPRQ